MPPQITTIIPTYRRPNLLRRAIQSVLNQTYTDFQVCVYDNASGDETSAVVAEFAQSDDRVKYYCHSRNIGAVANFNFGMSQVNTPYFSFLSDDDLVLPSFFETALLGFAQYPDIMFSAGDTIGVTESGQIGGVKLAVWSRTGYFVPPSGLFEMLNAGNVPGMTGILFNAELSKKLEGFDRDIRVNDFDLELRIAAQFPFVVSPTPCALFTAQTTSISVLHQWDFLYQDYPKVISKLRNDTNIPLETREKAVPLLVNFLRATTFRAGLSAIVAGNFDEARKLGYFLESYYHWSERAKIVITLANLCQHVPSVRVLLSQVYKYRKSQARKAVASLQLEYADLARYLKI